MNPQDEPKAEERLSTDAQVQLALQLYHETDYERQYSMAELHELSRDDISKHIHVVKEAKVRSQALRAQNERGAVFDKIGHAMLFKLVWGDEDRVYFKHRCQMLGLEGAMGELYETYKKCEAAVKKSVQESALK